MIVLCTRIYIVIHSRTLSSSTPAKVAFGCGLARRRISTNVTKQCNLVKSTSKSKCDQRGRQLQKLWRAPSRAVCFNGLKTGKWRSAPSALSQNFFVSPMRRDDSLSMSSPTMSKQFVDFFVLTQTPLHTKFRISTLMTFFCLMRKIKFTFGLARALIVTKRTPPKPQQKYVDQTKEY